MSVDTIARDLAPTEPAPCPDPNLHTSLYAQSERTWRLTSAQRQQESLNGCPWCGGQR